jgi:hypothetical protein
MVMQAETLLCKTSEKEYIQTEGNKMKRFIVAAVLVAALMAMVAGTALAAGPITPPGQAFGPAAGIQATDTYPCGAMGAGGMMGRGAPEWAGDSPAVEDLLGMSEEDIQAERLAGKSLVEIAAAKHLTEDDLINAILSAKTDLLDSLVAEGKLTQARADFMIENMTAQVKTMVERTDVGPAFSQDGAGFSMGRGMRGGRWNR